MACFKGTLPSRVNSLQQKLQNTDIVSQPDNRQQVKKLTELESQAWLYKGILERLGEDPSANHERIARTLEALEYKRHEILQELEPRRPQRYQAFAEIQKSARIFLASQAEEDYERIDRLVTNLVLFTRSRRPSQTILLETIDKIAVLIAQNNNKISPYRLRLTYKIEDLLKVISVKLVLEASSSRTDSTYQAYINELRSRISLLSQQFNSLLRSRQENANELNKSIQKISNLNRAISDLEKDIQTVKELDQRKQIQINDLQNLLSQQEIELQQKSHIEQQYERLYQLYQQQRNEINGLKTQLAQVNQSKPFIRPVATERTVSVEEYQRISNQNDYVYIDTYYREDGTRVRAHYRKKPNR